MKALFHLHVFLAIIAFAFPAFAQNGAIGTFIEVEGAAFITHAGQKSAAAVDMPVYSGDSVETTAGSKANIVFIDDTEITLGENAALTIDQYVFDDGAATGNKGRYSFLRGAFLFTSGLMTKNDRPDVTLETAYGSIGLRGTTVWGGEIDREYGVLVQEGEVTVTTNRGRIRVPAGQGTNIRSRDSIPTLAAVWRQEKIDHATRMVALKRKELVQQRIAARKQKNAELRGKRDEMPRTIAPEPQRKLNQEMKERPEQTPDEMKMRMEENRARILNKRKSFRERMKDAPPDDGTARSQEQRENFLLRNDAAPGQPALQRMRPEKE